MSAVASRQQLVLLAVGIYIVLRPLVGLGHELSVCGVANLFHAAVDTGFWQPIIAWLHLDPIYAGAAMRAMGGVQVAGLAIAGPLGSWLHGLVPWLVLSPDRVTPAAGISMVAAPGAPALGRGLAGFGADVLWLALGLGLAGNWRERGSTVGLLGLFIQGQIVINHLLDANVPVPDLEASGLPFALALALPNSGAWFTTGLAQAPDPLRAVIVGGSLVVCGYACAALLLVLVSAVLRLIRWRRFEPGTNASSSPRWLLAAGGGLAVLLAVSPVGAVAVGEPNWAGVSLRELAPGGPTLVAAAGAGVPDPRSDATGPVSVRLAQRPDGAWQYLVADQPQVIRGVGYNPQYASLNASDRAKLYQRDFGRDARARHQHHRRLVRKPVR